MYLLDCVVQNYAWGKMGKNSVVATLKAAGSDGTFIIQESQPYAELWMGTHPNGPSSIIVNNHGDKEDLLAWLQKHPQAVGKFPGDLPYLFKVLSVNTALSIQAHPDKQLGQELHLKFPDLYKDGNHKPEMAIAITLFEALCQFRPLSKIVDYVQTVPELQLLVDANVVSDLIQTPSKDTLAAFFKAFIYCSTEVAMKQLHAMTLRLNSQVQNARVLTDVEQLFLRLHAQYPNDIGAFCPFLLNYIVLQPGQAVFLDANEPHAYISGDCMECMACSDNVVRAGLTPKFIDKLTLCNMLTYKAEKPMIQTGHMIDSCTKQYLPPVREFQIENIRIPNQTKYTLPSRQGCSILIIVHGRGQCMSKCENSTMSTMEQGQIYLVPANEVFDIENRTTSPLEMYRASPNENI